ncbi:hypothetical protein ACE418_09480 [Megasphaera sp. WILCCON 0056]|uniref:hypothetical protein n=1 Tax=Megasphaera sp. WILCCON 0056 TaxID=3345340 RepID=UPI003A80BA3A
MADMKGNIVIVTLFLSLSHAMLLVLMYLLMSPVLGMKPYQFEVSVHLILLSGGKCHQRMQQLRQLAYSLAFRQWVHQDSMARTYTLPITMKSIYWRGSDFGYCYGYASGESTSSVSFNAFDVGSTSARTTAVSAFIAVIGSV